ncbi:MAG: hypothetical protein ACO1O6_10595 [Bacteroidota bacterium]
MSYDIRLYRKEVKDQYQEAKDADFFENDNNMIPFTSQQHDGLKTRLLNYGYVIESDRGGHVSFGFKNDPGVSALLTRNCLYFSSAGEGIFEISMTSSEFTDNGEFAKYDPQSGGWEEFE